MRGIFVGLAIVALTAPAPSAQGRKSLDIYIVDVEGGKATLFVTPSGESALIDTGSPGERDVERIMAAINDAGLKQIDHLLSTHYHVDHIGGMQELAKRIPIRHFIDHGPTVEEREQVAGFQQAYAELRSKAKHTVVKPGDKIPVAGLDWTVVISAAQAIKKPLPGGGKANPYCAEFKPRENTRDPENGQSVGSVIAFGKFRTIDLGDLLWNNEFDLMCPNNPIGAVDLYLTSHHGTDPSGSVALVHALQPRVAITQNGMRKGGTVQTFQTVNSSPGFDDLWQLHWSHTAGIEHNPAGAFIANVDEPATIAAVLTAAPPRAPGGPPASAMPSAPAATPSAGAPPASAPAAPPAAERGAGPPQGRQGGPGGGRGGHTGPAYWIKVSAQPDGSFTVTNSRNGFSKTYRAR